jgi:hypothetical protein
MRCTRCDRPAVPQAVGLSREGLVVFGWCVDCLRERGCTDVEVARPARGDATLRLPAPSASEGPPGRGDGGGRRSVAIVARLLGGWAGLLIAAGSGLLWTRSPSPRVASPFGNGTPALLIGGGVATAATALLIAALGAGRPHRAGIGPRLVPRGRP